MPEHIALDQVESTLMRLIEMLRDSQEEFREIGERVHDERTKHFFLEETQKRAGYAAELENELHRMGVHDVKAAATRVGKARLHWTEVKANLAGHEQTLMQAMEESEDRTRDAYAGALREELPLPLREMLDRHFAHIQRSHDQVKALRDKC